MTKKNKNKIVRSLLMQWHNTQNMRSMPWKGEKDPYKIWLSEIILQQTRVEQGLAYYERFIYHFPTIQSLANAEDEFVFKLWEGLGYYNRCKNLLATARLITQNMNGVFPKKHEQIIQLKGIGPYTAAAIASFAFRLPYAVLDGNVFRVLARIFAIETPTDNLDGKKYFAELAQDILDKENPDLFNQAIMDFGATVCKPFNPLCNTCLLETICEAHQKGMVQKLPIKEKVLKKKNRWFYYFKFIYKEQVLVQKRSSKDIWENLNEYYLIETFDQKNWTKDLIDDSLLQLLAIKDYELISISPITKQQLTHQRITGQLITIRVHTIPKSLQQMQWITIPELVKLAFPKFINSFTVEKEI